MDNTTEYLTLQEASSNIGFKIGHINVIKVLCVLLDLDFCVEWLYFTVKRFEHD